MVAAAEAGVSYRLAARPASGSGTLVRVRDVVIGGSEFVVIAGPCSVETDDQVRRILERIARSGAALFRAGAYKPRTSPYAFQGPG